MLIFILANCYKSQVCNNIGYFFVGYDGNNALSTCECYFPEKNSWSLLASMESPRHAFSMAELQGWLYVSGGSNFASMEYNTAERYDPIRYDKLDIGCFYRGH